MSDSSCLIRRCFISCRVSSLQDAERFALLKSIDGVDGRAHSIKRIVCAYNAGTKEARMYLEIERIPERVLVSFMDEFGITSVSVDTFSHAEWRSASANALTSVRETAAKEGFRFVASSESEFSFDCMEDEDAGGESLACRGIAGSLDGNVHAADGYGVTLSDFYLLLFGAWFDHVGFYAQVSGVLLHSLLKKPDVIVDPLRRKVSHVAEIMGNGLALWSRIQFTVIFPSLFLHIFCSSTR